MTKLTYENEMDVNAKFDSIKNGNCTAQDTETVMNHMDDILEKSEGGALAKFADDIQTMCQMAKAWACGEYKGVPVKTIGMIILTLLYVFSPIDIIPDFIPGLGLVDDAGMVALCIAAARSDINDFRIWARSRHKLLK